jgi:hypothetical protein
MIANINQTCSSHMPVLIELLRTVPIASVIEFGSGVFSTQLFASKCQRFTSIESGDGSWFTYLQKRYANRTWELKMAATEALALAEVKPCDLMFVDGHFREAITLKAFTVCPLIVCHDSQYGWTFRIKVPPEFGRIDFTKFPTMYPNHELDVLDDRPWTTVFASDKRIIDSLAGKEAGLYEQHKVPYGVNTDIN